MIKRVITIVLDGFGVGEAPDANVYGDEGSNTLKGIYDTCHPKLPNMKKENTCQKQCLVLKLDKMLRKV